MEDGLRRGGRDLVVVEDGVGEDAVGLALDERPIVAVDLDEALEDGEGLLVGEAESPHGRQRPPRPRRVGARPRGSHPRLRSGCGSD